MGKSIKRAKRDTVEGRRKLKAKNYSKFNATQARTYVNDILKNKGIK